MIGWVAEGVVIGLQDMSVVPGVRIEDMGHKMGCNGVDNGKLWFDRESFSHSFLEGLWWPFACMQSSVFIVSSLPILGQIMGFLW